MGISSDLKFLLEEPKRVLDPFINLRTRLADLNTLNEVFVQQTYRWLCTDMKKDTVVVDIGGYIGETAIYFAMFDRAKKVYAYEPVYNSYKRGVANIAASGLGGKIRFINAAIGKADTKIFLPKNINGITMLDAERLSDRGNSNTYTIDVKTLDSVLDRIGRSKDVVIKLDSDGNEADILRECDLGNVYRIQLEFHESYSEVISILRRKRFKTGTRNRHRGVIYKDIGDIYAWR